MIVFGFSSLPAPHAGQFTWQRPHSTHVNASSTILLPRSFTVSSPTCSFSKSRFGTLPSSGDFRNTVIGESTRWKCFDAGISARNARMTNAWIHQLTRPASDASSSRQVRRNVDHQRRDEQRDDDRLDRDVLAETDRPHEGAPDEQVDDADQHRDRKRREHDPVRGKPAAVRQVDDAETAQELDGRVAAERDEAPEHERVRQAGDRTLDESSDADRRRRRRIG